MKSNLQIIKEFRLFLNQAMNDKLKYCQRPQDFSRNRLLSFDQVAYFILNLSKRSLSIELDDFFESLYPKVTIPSKGAFSQARYKLKPVLFEDWNKAFINCCTTQGLLKQNWRGFLLVGIDGTTLQLPETPSIQEEFSVKANQHLAYPMAQVLCAYDVLNGFCLLSKIAPVTNSEPKMALDLVRQLPKNSLSIYDRGFTGSALIHLLSKEERHFLIRSKLGFNKQVKAFVKSSKTSQIIDMPLTSRAKKNLEEFEQLEDFPKKVKVRLIKVVLNTGQTEVLMTSLLDRVNYPVNMFKELYFYRWGVEVYYDLFKNIIQVEIFTGHKPEAIYQEFYAMILLSNLHQLIVLELSEPIKQANRSRKYEHKINKNVSIGLMKNKIIELLIKDEPKLIWILLKEKFLKHTIPIVPNRTTPRKTHPRRIRGKYKTFTNYRRAA